MKKPEKGERYQVVRSRETKDGIRCVTDVQADNRVHPGEVGTIDHYERDGCITVNLEFSRSRRLYVGYWPKGEDEINANLWNAGLKVVTRPKQPPVKYYSYSLQYNGPSSTGGYAESLSKLLSRLEEDRRYYRALYDGDFSVLIMEHCRECNGDGETHKKKGFGKELCPACKGFDCNEKIAEYIIPSEVTADAT